MKVSSSGLFVGIVCVVPWLLASVGAEQRLGETWIFLIVFSFSIMTALAIALINQSIVRNREKYYSSSDNSFLRKLVFYIIVTCYIVYCIRVSNLLIINSFNFAAVRYDYFRSPDTIQNIFFGNKFIGMFFTWIVQPLSVLYFLTLKKLNLEELMVLTLYVVSGIIIGGRFTTYRIAIILFLNYFVGVKKFSLIKKKNLTYTFSLLVIFFLLSVGMGANRSFYTSAQPSSYFDSFKEAFLSVYEYHSIQFGVISLSSDAPMQHGIFTGLLTPFYVFSGLPSPEGQLYAFLDKIQFSVGNGKEANAFGTSIMFFMPMVNSDMTISIFLFFSTVLLLLVFLAYFVKGIEKLILLKYLLFSLFFSAFQPFMFSFSWWLSIFMIFAFCRVNSFRTTRPLERIKRA